MKKICIIMNVVSKEMNTNTLISTKEYTSFLLSLFASNRNTSFLTNSNPARTTKHLAVYLN